MDWYHWLSGCRAGPKATHTYRQDTSAPFGMGYMAAVVHALNPSTGETDLWEFETSQKPNRAYFDVGSALKGSSPK